MADATFGEREQRHRRRREGGKADPDPAHTRMVAAEQRSERLDQDVGDEQRVARRDELLRASLGLLGMGATVSEAPEDDEGGKRLDQAVAAEADQRDRARGDPGADRDPELDRVPGVAAPGEQPRPADEPRALVLVEWRWPFRRNSPRAASGVSWIRPPRS